jgi:hypothetical protein
MEAAVPLFASVGHALAWLLLLPGDLVCDAVGVAKADNRDLLRMLINSLVWGLACIVVGIIVFQWSGP